jgi:hypothetical protein
MSKQYEKMTASELQTELYRLVVVRTKWSRRETIATNKRVECQRLIDAVTEYMSKKIDTLSHTRKLVLDK